MKISETLSPRKQWALGPPILLVQQGGLIENILSEILREIVPQEKASTRSPHALRVSGLGVLVMYSDSIGQTE